MSNKQYCVGHLKSRNKEKYEAFWDEIDKDVWISPEKGTGQIALGKAATAYEAVDLAKAYLSKIAKLEPKKAGCFIATAVCGSPFANEVIVLRQFRDDYLSNYRLGRTFIKFYYWISPSIATQISKSNKLRSIIKTFLIIPLVKFISNLKLGENKNVNN